MLRQQPVSCLLCGFADVNRTKKDEGCRRGMKTGDEGGRVYSVCVCEQQHQAVDSERKTEGTQQTVTE